MRGRLVGIAVFLLVATAAGVAVAHGLDEGDTLASGTGDESFAEAQERLDPTSDPETVLQQSSSGDWVAFDVIIDGRLPESVATVDDLARQLAQNEFESGEISKGEVTARSEAISRQYQCLTEGMTGLRNGDAVSSEEILAATTGCSK